MIKFLIAFAPPLGVSRAACLAHYRDNHGALVASVPGFRRETRAYFQNEVIEDAMNAAEETVIAGVSELWFDDWSRYHAAFSDPEYLEHIRPDEQRFADLSTVLVNFANEVRLYGGEDVPKYKLFRFWKPIEKEAAAEFHDRWADYGASLVQDEIVRATATAYIQNRAVSPEENPFPEADIFEGIDEFWLRRPEDARRLMPLLSGHADHACLAQVAQADLQLVAGVRIIPGFNG